MSLTEEQRKELDEMAGNFERTLGSNRSVSEAALKGSSFAGSRDPEESDEDFFRSW